MLALEDFLVIQALVKRGVYLCDIAGQLGSTPEQSGAHFNAAEPRLAAAADGAAGWIRTRRSSISCWLTGCGTPW